MKRILVYLNECELQPKGGALGYNYHLKKQLDFIGIKHIHYLYRSAKFKKGANNRIKSIRSGLIKSILLIMKSVYKKSSILYGFNHKAEVDLNQYDTIHFHAAYDMYAVRDSLKKYNGSVVLTSHTPTRPSNEIYDNLTTWEKRHMNWFYKKLIKVDEYAFKRANYIIFPCPEAEEPYYNTWPEYSAIKDSKKDKYRYLLTGTEARVAKRDRQSVRKEYGIPEDAFVVSYVGRHNSIKGYDLLKLLGEEYLNKNKHTYFLIAGIEEPMKGLKHERWIEVGWTNDPHSLIAASDVFVLPNRETYFDLVLLEVLSLGKIILASNTGGNKYFERINAKGVLLFNDIDDAKKKLDYVKSLSEDEKAFLEKANEELFFNTFSLSVFAKNYVKLINSI